MNPQLMDPATYDERQPMSATEAITTSIHKLQWLQLQHDREYHADIFNLTPAAKLNHFVLHLNKYAPQLMTANRIINHTDQGELYMRTLTDFGIILLSMANVFKLRLGDYTAERIGDILDGNEHRECKVPMGLFLRHYGNATPNGLSLTQATITLLTASGECADVMIKHAQLEGNIRNSMTNLIRVMWEAHHQAWWSLAYMKDYLLEKEYEERIRNRLITVEMHNPHYASMPKYANDFAPVA